MKATSVSIYFARAPETAKQRKVRNGNVAGKERVGRRNCNKLQRICARGIAAVFKPAFLTGCIPHEFFVGGGLVR